MDSGKIDPLVNRISAQLRSEHGDVNVQVRETGRYMQAVIEPHDRPHVACERAKALIGEEDAWRLIEVVREQREDEPNRG
jgi:cobalt-zinc-cadmium efflux system protein